MVKTSESGLIDANSGTRTPGYIGIGPKDRGGMNRIAAIVASAWVVLAFGITGVAAAGPTPAEDVSGSPVLDATLQATNETNETTDGETETLAPGAKLAGVVGAQQAEIQGEVDSRSFGLAVAAARSNGSKARVIANQSDQLQERLRTLEARMTRLNQSYRNGSIATGAYHARLARLTAQLRMFERLTNETAESASTLPPETLRQQGVNVSRLERLRTHARNMTGPEVAAIARQVAGPNVGNPVGPRRGPPNDRPGHGPPGDAPGQDQSGDTPGQGQPGDAPGQGKPGDAPGQNRTNTTGADQNRTSGPPDSSGNGSGSDRGSPSDNRTVNRTDPGSPGNNGNGSDAANRSDPSNAVDQSVGPLTAFVRFITGLGF